MNILSVVQSYVKEALAILDSENLSTVVSEVKMNQRLVNSAGKAKYCRRPGTGERVYIIEVSGKIYTVDCPALRKTVFHEVAHLAALQNFNSFDHGPDFVHVMNILGYSGDATVCAKELQKQTGFVKPVRQQRKTRTLIKCISCDRTYRLLNSKLPMLNSYRCKCGSKLCSTGRKVGVNEKI
jgi:predicted SprT family Zn-dependent metalloprotease